jgi:hypothetical protein
VVDLGLDYFVSIFVQDFWFIASIGLREVALDLDSVPGQLVKKVSLRYNQTAHSLNSSSSSLVRTSSRLLPWA